MKKLFALMVLLCAVGIKSFAQEQATMPTLIVFPDENWMEMHGYNRHVDVDGETKVIPDYPKAFRMTREISTTCKAVQKTLNDMGFQVEDLQALMNGMGSERARELANAADGDEAEKGAMDELLQQANPDIIVNFGYSVKQMGPRKSITCDLAAVDAYTYQPVATCPTIIIESTTEPVELALKKAIMGHKDDFCQQLIDHFMDLRNNGRMITVIFRATGGIDFLRDEIDDEDNYADFLYNWVRKHAVHRAAKKGRQTKKMCEFKNVRIPFFNDDGDPIEAYDWAKKARGAFKRETGRKMAVGQGNTLGRVEFLVGVD